MLIDGGVAVNLMSYVVFKKLGREDDELMKTNLMLNGVGAGGQPNGGQRCHLHGAHRGGANHSLPHSSSLRCKVTIASFLVMIGFTPTTAFLLLCINS
jgi:hypothetical protein